MGEQHQCKKHNDVDTKKTEVSAWARGLPSRFRMDGQRASLDGEHTVALVTRQKMRGTAQSSIKPLPLSPLHMQLPSQSTRLNTVCID